MRTLFRATLIEPGVCEGPTWRAEAGRSGTGRAGWRRGGVGINGGNGVGGCEAWPGAAWPEGWAGGLDGLPPVILHSTLTLTDESGRTRINVTVRCNSIAERDENVKRGFALMVGTGNDRLEDYLKTLNPAQA